MGRLNQSRDSLLALKYALIMPTLIGTRLTGKKKYGYAYAIGLRGYLLGLILSVSYDRPWGQVLLCV
ncbi:hypothetical protein [Thalassotalea agariperforans]